MATIGLVFDTLDAANPATPPSGYAKPTGSDPGKIFGVSPKVFGSASGATTMWYNTTSLTGDVISARITLPATPSSDPVGAALINSAGDGFMVITGTSSNNFRIFPVLNGQLSGTALMTAAVAPIGNAEIELRRSIVGADHQYEVFQNGSKVGTTYTSNTLTLNYGAVVARPNSSVVAMEVEYVATSSIDTITDPLIPGSAFSGTTTGFTDGAATLSFTGQSVAVTIATGEFSGTLPTFADGEEWPVLPATDQIITLTQGALVPTILADISLPSGYDVTRNGATPANFANIITTDDTYLGYYFVQSGNPLTTNDRCYFPSANGLIIGQDSSITATEGTTPFTTTIFIHRADGNVYTHELTVNEQSTGDDTTPNQFTFTDVVGSALSTVNESNSITVSGVTAAVNVSISITGGEYQINGGAWVSTAGNVQLNDTVKVRVTSSASYSTASIATLIIGGVSDTYSVTTLQEEVTMDETELSLAGGTTSRLTLLNSINSRGKLPFMPDSTATTVAEFIADLNSLLAAMRTANWFDEEEV